MFGLKADSALDAKKIWAILVFVIGILISLIGAGSVVGYIVWAVIERWGDPDPSLLFWYLPFLLFGIVGWVIGLSGCVWAYLYLKRPGQNETAGHKEMGGE
jgi:hypothetical protein